MKILITGGAGFIGSNLCARLLTDGHNVSVIDNFSTQVHGNSKIIDNRIDLLIGDASLKSSYRYFFGQHFDCIILLAAETGTGQSMFEAHKYCSTNINSIAVLNDLILAGKISASKIILASSRSVYGDAKLDNFDLPIASKETDKTNPRSIYAITKLTQEQLLFSGFGDVDVCALRFQNVYGPGQSLSNPYTGILSIFSTAIKNNKDIQVFDDGLMSRDFVYIDDVVDSLLLCIYNPESNGHIFNVGSGERTTVLKVAQTLKQKYSSDVNINITGEKLKGDIRHNYADISKIKLIGWTAKYNFEIGVDKLISWVESKQIQTNNYEHSIAQLRESGILK